MSLSKEVNSSLLSHKIFLFIIEIIIYNNMKIWEILCNLSEKAMASHSSTLAWKIPWTEEPGGLQSLVSQRVGHD